MKYLVLFVAIAAFCENTYASPSPTSNLQDSAKKYLEGAISSEWEGAKWTEQCEKVKALKSRYSYRCIFEATDYRVGGAYAVYLDERMKLVALVSGEGRKKGKEMAYTFRLKDAIGYEKIKSVQMKGKEAGK